MSEDTQEIKPLTDEEAAKLCSLVREPHMRLYKLTNWLVQQHGNDSEKHGTKFGLFPKWAGDRAKQLLDAIVSPHDLPPKF